MSTPTQRQLAIATLFKRRRAELHLSQEDVARGVRELLGGEGFKQQSYAAIEAGRTKHSKYLPQIARVLGIPAQVFDPSLPPPALTSTTNITYSDTATVLGETGRKLPVIGSIAAGAWCEAVALQPDAVEEWIESPGPVGPRAFVLKIDGISMYNPGGPVSFADGDQVVIDPDVEPLPGDFVVARLTNSNRVTFKRLRQDEGECYLEAINPAWEPRYIRITEDWHICGKAKWKVQRL